MTIKECLENNHNVILERRYCGYDACRVKKDGLLGETFFDEVADVEEELLWCNTCGIGFLENWELVGSEIRCESLGNL